MRTPPIKLVVLCSLLGTGLFWPARVFSAATDGLGASFSIEPASPANYRPPAQRSPSTRKLSETPSICLQPKAADALALAAFAQVCNRHLDRPEQITRADPKEQDDKGDQNPAAAVSDLAPPASSEVLQVRAVVPVVEPATEGEQQHQPQSPKEPLQMPAIVDRTADDGHRDDLPASTLYSLLAALPPSPSPHAFFDRTLAIPDATTQNLKIRPETLALASVGAPTLPAEMSIPSVKLTGPSSTLAPSAGAKDWVEKVAPGSGENPAVLSRKTGYLPVEPAASNPASERRWPSDDQLAVNDAHLDEMRGGFETNTGLRISFGIERMISVNGNLVTTTSFNIADLGKITADEARLLGAATGTLAVIQNGTGNTLLPGSVSQGAIGTVIQNALNNQKIQGLTTINATVNSFELIKNLNLQSVLKDAIANSIGGR